jgi:hypothetical protein
VNIAISLRIAAVRKTVTTIIPLIKSPPINACGETVEVVTRAIKVARKVITGNRNPAIEVVFLHENNKNTNGSAASR